MVSHSAKTRTAWSNTNVPGIGRNWREIETTPSVCKSKISCFFFRSFSIFIPDSFYSTLLDLQHCSFERTFVHTPKYTASGPEVNFFFTSTMVHRALFLTLFTAIFSLRTLHGKPLVKKFPFQCVNCDLEIL